MGMQAAATARQNKLKRNAEWRANRRLTSDEFKKAEKASHDKYGEFRRLSMEFTRAYPNEFKTFLLTKQHNQVARQSFGIPRDMNAPIEAAPSRAP